MIITSSKEAMYWIGMHMVPNIVGVARFWYGFHRTGSENGLALDLVLGAESAANILSDAVVILLLWKSEKAQSADADPARMVRVLGAFVAWNTVALLLCCGGNLAGLRYPPKWYTYKDADDLDRREKVKVVAVWAPVIILSALFKLYYTSLLYDFYNLYKASGSRANDGAKIEAVSSQRTVTGFTSGDSAMPATATGTERTAVETSTKYGTRWLSVANVDGATVSSPGNTRSRSLGRPEPKPNDGGGLGGRDSTRKSRPAGKKARRQSAVGEGHSTTGAIDATLRSGGRGRRRSEGASSTSRAASTSRSRKSANKPQALQRQSFSAVASMLKSGLSAASSGGQSIGSTRPQSNASTRRQSVSNRRRQSVGGITANETTGSTASQKTPRILRRQSAPSVGTSAPAKPSTSIARRHSMHGANVNDAHGSSLSRKSGFPKGRKSVADVNNKATVLRPDINARRRSTAAEDADGVSSANASRKSAQTRRQSAGSIIAGRRHSIVARGTNGTTDTSQKSTARSRQQFLAATEAVSSEPPANDRARQSPTGGAGASDASGIEAYRNSSRLSRRKSIATLGAPGTASPSRDSARRRSIGGAGGREVTGGTTYRTSPHPSKTTLGLAARGAAVPRSSTRRLSIGGRRGSEAPGGTSYRKSPYALRRQCIIASGAIEAPTPPRPSARRQSIGGGGGSKVSGNAVDRSSRNSSRRQSEAVASVTAMTHPSKKEARRPSAEDSSTSDGSPARKPTDRKGV